MATAKDTKIEGWLLKKGVKGFSKSFKKRWFALQNGKLHYYQNRGDTQSLGSIDVMAASSIVPSGTRRNSEFQIITPGRVFTLQAATDQEMNEWVTALNTYQRHMIRKSRGVDESAADSAAAPRRASMSSAPIQQESDLLSPDLKAAAAKYETISSPGRRNPPPARGALTNSFYGVSGGGGGGGGGSSSPADNNAQSSNSESADPRVELEKTKAELLKLKETVVLELRALESKQESTQEELHRVRDALAAATATVRELRLKEEERALTASNASSSSSSSDELVKALRQQLADKEEQLDEQNKRVELLKAKLEQRIEEEASQMKAKVKETMARLRQEHEEQLRKARAENGSFNTNNNNNNNDQQIKTLKAEKANLEERLRQALAKVAELERRG